MNAYGAAWDGPNIQTGANWGVTPPPEVASGLPGYAGYGHSTGSGTDGPPGEWWTANAYSWEGGPDNLVTDPSIGGSPAHSLTTGFTYGGVESNTVEDFTMTGAQARLRQQLASSPGPVGQSSASAIAAAGISQTYWSDITDEQVAASMIQGI